MGDYLVVERWADAKAGGGAARIVGVVPRRSLLVRRAAGERTAPQPLAANVDTAFIVTSANLERSPRRLERYLLVARDAGVTPVVLLSKVDLADDVRGAHAELAAVAGGAEVLALSALRGDGIDLVRARLGGGTGVLLGSSGVGKSTLLNRLLGGDAQATQATSELGDRGRHTTTRRELFVVPGGGVLIDTPGMRELAAWADAADDDGPDVLAELAARCRFADCRHAGEPGCAVRAALDAGEVTPERIDHARQLAAERAASARRRDEAARREASRTAKVAQRSYREASRRKGRE
ncbi:MAG: ribosome small subunit-dependent GTPase A [Kofleriaceae bacterium]